MKATFYFVDNSRESVTGDFCTSAMQRLLEKGAVLSLFLEGKTVLINLKLVKRIEIVDSA